MDDTNQILARIQTRRHLEDINHYVLHDEGQIMAAPGKLSLVWTDPALQSQRFLSVKAAGADQILVNGRRYPASEAGLQQGLKACLASLRS